MRLFEYIPRFFSTSSKYACPFEQLVVIHNVPYIRQRKYWLYSGRHHADYGFCPVGAIVVTVAFLWPYACFWKTLPRKPEKRRGSPQGRGSAPGLFHARTSLSFLQALSLPAVVGYAQFVQQIGEAHDAKAYLRVCNVVSRICSSG
jgi:hypothetical protein